MAKIPVLYFAYGSNMAFARLQSRISDAKDRGKAYIQDRKLVFNKRSKDGSGKANLVESPGDITWGVLYEITEESLAELDKIEGGYKRVRIQVHFDNTTFETAITYISEKLTLDPIPYDWYKTFVISGAEEHSLPSEYLEYLNQFPSKPDTRAS